MAPFFALGHALGLPDWVVGRLWLGTLLALARGGWCACSTRSPGARAASAHLAGGLLYVLNPYVVTYVGRTSDHADGLRGAAVAAAVRAPRAARPARLVVAGGLRADPDLDRRRGQRRRHRVAAARARAAGGLRAGRGARWRRARRARFLVRSCRSAALASLWWVAAVLVHARYGLDFLPFTEQPGTIWSTTSLPESLRLLGFWTSYIGVGYTGVLRAFQADAGVYLRLAPVVARDAGRAGAVPAGLRVDAARALRAVLPRARPARPARDGRRVPRGHAAALGRRPFTYNHVRPCASCARRYKAGSLRGARARGSGAAWRGVGARARARLRARGARGGRARAGRARRLAARARRRRWTASSRLHTACPRRGATPAHDLDRTLPRSRRAWCCPASSSPSTAGAGPTTRSCRR